MPSRFFLYADRQLVVAGVSELLRDGAFAPVELELGSPGGGDLPSSGLRAALVDVTAPGADHVTRSVRTRAEALILLLGAPEDLALCAAASADADAVLLRDQLDVELLRVALSAGRLGLRVSSREITGTQPGVGALPGLGVASGLPVGVGSASASAVEQGVAAGDIEDRAVRALQFLAQGLRDAEIASALNLSESATRKLIQRAVTRAGARTRTQAVAAAIRAGELA